MRKNISLKKPLTKEQVYSADEKTLMHWYLQAANLYKNRVSLNPEENNILGDHILKIQDRLLRKYNLTPVVRPEDIRFMMVEKDK